MKKHSLKKFFKIIEVTPNSEDLYHRALTHRSFVNEVEGEIKNNERLEYLGDAVLELATSEHLFHNYPDYPEGDLTSFRAAVVRTESLAEEANRLKIGAFMYMSKGEEKTGGRERAFNIENALEAIIGAIYLDQSYEVAKKFVEKNICYKIPEIVENRLDIDAKSRLQEISQEILKITPVYEFIDARGPDHDKTFEMAVMIGEQKFGSGNGRTKQIAEQNAAEQALNEWQELIKTHFPDIS